jgi:Uma2 family endonuclease
MTAPAKLWTLDEFYALPDDGRRYELIDGRLIVDGVLVPLGDLALLERAMTPPPPWRHQLAVTLLSSLLLTYVVRFGIGHAIAAPADVPLGEGLIVRPDIFVIPTTAAGRMPLDWAEAGGLLLAVEVLSPSSAHADKVTKRSLYLSEGVPEYWIVDVDSRAIDRWQQGDTRPALLDEKVEWLPRGASEPLVIDLVEFFAIVDPARADT